MIHYVIIIYVAQKTDHNQKIISGFIDIFFRFCDCIEYLFSYLKVLYANKLCF